MVFGLQRYRLSKRVNKRVMSVKALEALRGSNVFDMIEMGREQ